MKVRTLSPEVVKGKIVVVRADFNVPLADGKILDNTRIASSLPTIKFLLEHGAKRVHLLSHLGRPKGTVDPKFSLEVVAKELEKLLGETVEFRKDFTAGEGKIQLHENVRFDPGEKKNDPAYAQKILDGTGAEVFVNDGFGVSHRAHASVVGLAEKIPAYAGFLVEKEIKNLSPYLSEERISGLTVIVGGAKMETKVNVLRHFAETAKNILIGGALANTFLAAKGYDIGESLYEDTELENAQEVLMLADQYKTGLHLPVDVVCADDMDSDQILDMPIEDVMGVARILDIGPRTIASFCEIIRHSSIIIWNGPVGFYEKSPFDKGTKLIAQAIAANESAKTILGGGDTINALQGFGIESSKFTHVSTGGGAMMEFLEGKELPGIEILRN